MKIRHVLVGLAFTLAFTLALTGCSLIDPFQCRGPCGSSARSSSSLVSFLYPRGTMVPTANSVPQLNLPLRVGIAFIPENYGSGVATGLEASRREEILERIRKRFADRKFVSQIVAIPDYYLRGRMGFETLEGVQRLCSIDVLALVSYDQVMRQDRNDWALGYLTVVGAYVFKGSQHDVLTLMDLAVVDPASRSIILRAGGTNERTKHTTAVDESRETRESQAAGFSAATDDLIAHFDQALAQFEKDVRAGNANVRVATRAPSSGGGGGGGGAFDGLSLVALAAMLVFMRFSAARRLRASSLQ